MRNVRATRYLAVQENQRVLSAGILEFPLVGGLYTTKGLKL